VAEIERSDPKLGSFRKFNVRRGRKRIHHPQARATALKRELRTGGS
jgi:hypothetical protein